MKEYQIDDDNFRTCVIIPDSSEVEIKTDATSLDVFDWLKQEGICRNFLVDKCSSEMNCHLVHPPTKSPYLWQYKKACNNEVWNNFSNEINSSIEKKYCDPSASQFVNGNLHIMFSSGISPCGTYDGYNVTVRRLSTMSAVQTAAEEAFISTEWKWYWQMNVEKWEEYKHNDKCNPFEKAYIKGDQHCNFSTNQFKYKLYFQEMTQENQDERYRTKRNVRRRPVFKEAELIRKKDEFSKRLTNVNEMTLYHGTSHTVIDQICVQNFDWRVCGKNATHFGQGSYFSNNASYSHKYSTSDASGIFYMFVAEVLVGQYAKGVSSMKRPPNLPNSNVELYDSCVNDVNNPIIFVIYERDQCYPRYLLSYRQRPYFPLPDKLMRR
ncbi:protein mono-ADP-ribosyltransferase PARP12-like isoform X2 [Hydractinia symbiolongicarpus]|uniref:protein mono-ADP-ribosyltransferase PARP12-like isoform X2 n=1 Tax=Hydractinia symbiolongicarpus TaxID=13093 RepID=UPI00255008A3|nr:protein mono-ADP-ribosyltransferase PARP12-like isoform X2 [Hydractinia symbiolongicarpus]